ncbi:type II secretion system protein [Phascolarctobacterium faecium]|uniref:type II secretion system protein n=1 Tax=Phascolarctobacterium faecium TaxID=33025 RepID=UPI002742973A|nr:prepilin-type N-terminal cleavage/methylation domain-containing protein [Phascolarctobacterium faecium]
MKNFIKNQKGFTLVELVVVIAILGILAGIAIPRFMSATETARGAKTVADLRTLESAAVMYYAKTGVVPTKTDLEKGNAKLGTTALVASWPVPASGKAIIKNNANEELSWDIKATEYEINDDGRPVIGAKDAGKTIDDLLKATAGGDL